MNVVKTPPNYLNATEYIKTNAKIKTRPKFRKVNVVDQTTTKMKTKKKTYFILGSSRLIYAKHTCLHYLDISLINNQITK